MRRKRSDKENTVCQEKMFSRLGYTLVHKLLAIHKKARPVVRCRTTEGECEVKRKYKITIPKNGTFTAGQALLIGEKGDGYLWLGDPSGVCIGFIDIRQLDAISKAWLSFRKVSKK